MIGKVDRVIWEVDRLIRRSYWVVDEGDGDGEVCRSERVRAQRSELQSTRLPNTNEKGSAQDDATVSLERKVRVLVNKVIVRDLMTITNRANLFIIRDRPNKIVEGMYIVRKEWL